MHPTLAALIHGDRPNRNRPTTHYGTPDVTQVREPARQAAADTEQLTGCIEQACGIDRAMDDGITTGIPAGVSQVTGYIFREDE